MVEIGLRILRVRFSIFTSCHLRASKPPHACHEFWVTGVDQGKKPLPTRDAVVGKFGDANFKYFDGTDIPGEMREEWVPSAAKLNLKPSVGQILNTDHPVTI